MAIEENCKKILTPLQRFEHGLHPWVSYLIIPLFALANAGVTFAGMDIYNALTSSVSLGIIVGLFVGKQIGIFTFSWIAVKLNRITSYNVCYTKLLRSKYGLAHFYYSLSPD